MYALMNCESMVKQSRPNSEFELIDMGDNGIIRATGEGVRPIVEILNSVENSGLGGQFNATPNGARS